MVDLPKLKCTRCDWEWIPRKEDGPRVCPKCKSPYWDVERKEKEDANAAA